MAIRLCRACGDFHDLAGAWPSACYEHFGVVASSAPNIRTDGMAPIKSMASGQMFDSKSAYYRDIKQAGCEIVGNDLSGFGKRPDYRPEGLKQAIKEAMERNS